jgi:hypothetical protein
MFEEGHSQADTSPSGTRKPQMTGGEIGASAATLLALHYSTIILLVIYRLR